MDPITVTLYTAYAIGGISALVLLTIILYSDHHKRVQQKRRLA